MKKSQVKKAKIALLSYSAALAVGGSMISFDAAAACSDGGAATPVSCSFEVATGTPWAEAWSITGSNNVKIGVIESAGGFAACSYHALGTKSYGLTLAGGSMLIRDATGKAANATSGCAS